MKITLTIPDDFARELKEEYKRRQETKIASLRSANWDKQADALEIEEKSSAEAALAILTDEIGWEGE